MIGVPTSFAKSFQLIYNNTHLNSREKILLTVFLLTILAHSTSSPFPSFLSFPAFSSLSYFCLLSFWSFPSVLSPSIPSFLSSLLLTFFPLLSSAYFALLKNLPSAYFPSSPFFLLFVFSFPIFLFFFLCFFFFPPSFPILLNLWLHYLLCGQNKRRRMRPRIKKQNLNEDHWES